MRCQASMHAGSLTFKLQSFADAVVVGDSVLTATHDVESYEITVRALGLGGEETLLKCGGDNVVHSLGADAQDSTKDWLNTTVVVVDQREALYRYR